MSINGILEWKPIKKQNKTKYKQTETKNKNKNKNKKEKEKWMTTQFSEKRYTNDNLLQVRGNKQIQNKLNQSEFKIDHSSLALFLNKL